jgi:hypothetical protein
MGLFPPLPALSKRVLDNCRDAYRVDLKHFCEHDKHHEANVVRINERGKLCENLPFLALTCRQIFGEMWLWYFSATPSQGKKTTEQVIERLIKDRVQGENQEFRLLSPAPLPPDVTSFAE